MKTINMVITPKGLEYKTGDDKTIPFKNVLFSAINLYQVESRGLTLTQQREAMKVIDKLEDCTDEDINLEDADYDYLVGIIKKVKWTQNMRLFLAVSDKLLNPIEPAMKK